MKPCGMILRYMDLKKVKKWWFNIPLLVGQLFFMVAGTAYGKIKWEKRNSTFVDYAIIATFPILVLLTPPTVLWLRICLFIMAIIFGVAVIRNIPWRRVWRAAQVSHVRLVLEKLEPPPSFARRKDMLYFDVRVADFGYPKMKIQPWRESWNDGKRFEYLRPTFEPSDEFIAAMIEYAEAQVGKRYDEVQLLSYFPHLIVWIIYPPCWGKEIKIIKALNRPGALEVCVSGLVACLRWGEGKVDERGIRQSIRSLHNTAYSLVGRESEEMTDEYIELMKRTFTKFFKGYDTAVVWPCLLPLSENWEEKNE